MVCVILGDIDSQIIILTKCDLFKQFIKLKHIKYEFYVIKYCIDNEYEC